MLSVPHLLFIRERPKTKDQRVSNEEKIKLLEAELAEKNSYLGKYKTEEAKLRETTMAATKPTEFLKSR